MRVDAGVQKQLGGLPTPNCEVGAPEGRSALPVPRPAEMSDPCFWLSQNTRLGEIGLNRAAPDARRMRSHRRLAKVSIAGVGVCHIPAHWPVIGTLKLQRFTHIIRI